MRRVAALSVMCLFVLGVISACHRQSTPWTFADFPGFHTQHCTPTAEDQPDDRAQRLLLQFRPRIVVAPDALWPIDFYRDYLPNVVLRDADRAGTIISTTVTRETLQMQADRPHVYLDLQRLPDLRREGRTPVVYGRRYQESFSLPQPDGGIINRRLTFLKYNVVFARSGLPAGLPWLYDHALRVVRLDPDDWHQLDNFCAIHIVLDEADAPIAVLLAQHNHHRTYLIGCDLTLPADHRVVVTAAQRSNELYLDRGETVPVRHRTIPWARYLEYLLNGTNQPWVTADDITYGTAAGGEEVPYALGFLQPCDPFYTSRWMLGQYRPFFGIEIGRNGPPGADYYTLPALLPLVTLLQASYLRDHDADDLHAVRAAIDPQHGRFNAALLIAHGARKLARDLFAQAGRCPS